MSMPRTKSLTAAALLLGLVLSQAATAEWLHYANVVHQADSAKQKHPRTLTLWTVLPTEVGTPTLCSAYETNHPKENKGNIASTARIDRADGSTETLEFSGEVSGGLYFECQSAADPIAVGDLVTFDFDFDKFPRQKMKGARSDFFSVNGIVSNAGQISLRTVPPGVNPPDSGGQVYASNSLFAAESDKQRYPKTLTQSVVMAHDAESPVLCAGYSNVTAKANKGRIITAVVVMHRDGSVTDLSFEGRVADNIYAECQEGPSLIEGDAVMFNHVFRGLPRRFWDTGTAYGVVSSDGTPTLRANR